MASNFLFCGILISTLTYALINTFVRVVLTTIFWKDPPRIANLKRQLIAVKIELTTINMVDEFAKYAKLQRRIRKFSEEIAHESIVRSSSMVRVKVATSIVLHVLSGAFAFYLLWYYRHVSVLQVPRDWLYPFNKIISFPMESPGAIGITMWLAVCSTVAKTVLKNVV